MNPIQVSTNMAESGRRDTLLVTVLDTSLFKGQTDSGKLALFTPETTTAIAGVSKQIKNDYVSSVISN